MDIVIPVFTKVTQHVCALYLLADSEPFYSDAWTSRWFESKHKSDYGRFVLSAGNFYGDADKDKGELHHTLTLRVILTIVWEQQKTNDTHSRHSQYF